MVTKVDKQELEQAIRRKVAQTYEPVKPARQFGFVHHNVDCIGCRACEIACKDKNGLPPGPRFRRVMYIEGGTYPEVFAYKVNMSCNHCAEPACLPTCPTGAIWKRADNGVVDIDSTLCIEGRIVAQGEGHVGVRRLIRRVGGRQRQPCRKGRHSQRRQGLRIEFAVMQANQLVEILDQRVAQFSLHRPCPWRAQ